MKCICIITLSLSLPLKSKAILFKQMNTEKRFIYWMMKISVKLIRMQKCAILFFSSSIHMWWFCCVYWYELQTQPDKRQLKGREREKEKEQVRQMIAGAMNEFFLNLVNPYSTCKMNSGHKEFKVELCWAWHVWKAFFIGKPNKMKNIKNQIKWKK